MRFLRFLRFYRQTKSTRFQEKKELEEHDYSPIIKWQNETDDPEYNCADLRSLQGAACLGAELGRGNAQDGGQDDYHQTDH
jgi:hypothetical protein